MQFAWSWSSDTRAERRAYHFQQCLISIHSLSHVPLSHYPISGLWRYSLCFQFNYFEGLISFPLSKSLACEDCVPDCVPNNNCDNMKCARSSSFQYCRCAAIADKYEVSNNPSYKLIHFPRPQEKPVSRNRCDQSS